MVQGHNFLCNGNTMAVFLKCFAVGVALPGVSFETDVLCNLGGLGKSPAAPSFQKILTYQALGNTFSSLFRREKSNSPLPFVRV